MGASRTELFETIFGLHTKRSSGTIQINGKPTDVKCPADAINAGLALVPEDRKKDGLVLGLDVKQIFPSPLYSKYNAWVCLTVIRNHSLQKYINSLGIKSSSQQQLAKTSAAVTSKDRAGQMACNKTCHPVA